MASSSEEKKINGASHDLIQASASPLDPFEIDLLIGVADPEEQARLRRLPVADSAYTHLVHDEEELRQHLDDGRPAVVVLDDRFVAGGCLPLARQLLEDEQTGRLELLLLVDSQKLAEIEPLLTDDRVEFVLKPAGQPELGLRLKKLVEKVKAAAADESGEAEFPRACDEKLRLALNATQTGIWEWNVITNEVSWSEEIPGIFGLAPDEFRGTYEAYLELIHPEDVDEVQAAIAAVLTAPDQPYHVEHRLIWLDGSVHWLEGKGQALLDENGQLQSLIGIVSDITGRKTTEEALRRSEGRYRTLVENLPRSGIVLFDQDLRLILADGSIVDQLGFSKQSVEGKLFEEIGLPPEYIADGVKNMRQALRGTTLSSTRRFGELYLDYAYLPLANAAGEIEYGMLLVQDVTEQKRTEASLRQNEEWLKNILSSNPVIFLVLNKKGEISFAQGQGLGLIDENPGEIIGQSVYDLYQDSPQVIAALEKALAGQTAHEEIEIGQTVFDVSYAPYYEADVFAGVIAVLTDVSERVGAERALRESEARYSTLVNYANDGVVVIQDGQPKFVNRALCDLVGYTSAELLNLSAFELVPPDEREEIRERMNRRVAGDPLPTVIESGLICKDGSRVEVELSAGVIQFGNQPAIISIMRDITGRKKAEEALTLSEEKFAKAFYASPDSITISDLESGTLLEINEGFERVFGYTREEAIGRKTTELNLYTNPEDRQRMIDILVSDGRVKDLELIGRRKSGELRICLLSVETISIAERACLVTLVRDITETRAAENAVRVSERWYRLLAETLPNSFILLLDAEMGCLLADGPELEKIGISKEEVEGRIIWDVLASEFVEPLKTHFNRIGRGETVLVEMLLGDLTYSVTLLSLDDARYDGGTMMILAQNITEWKKVEKARQEAEILRLELDQEREMRELKSQFVSMVVHDFRNPVSVLQVSLHLLRKYYDRLDQAKRDNRIEVMLQQTAQLNQLIDDVLMIGEMEVAATDLQLEVHEIVLFCQDVFQEFIQSIDLNKFQVIFEDNNSLIHTTLDLALMRRVLFNLLTNAVKYSPDGGEICLRVVDKDGDVYISIEDEGIGIPEEHLFRLFEGFHRASNVGFIKGSGLGLAIVKQIIEAHNGEVYCESEVGKGSIFTVRLPLIDQ